MISSFVTSVASMAEPNALSTLDGLGPLDVLDAGPERLWDRASDAGGRLAAPAMTARVSALADVHARAAIDLHGALRRDGRPVSHVSILGDMHPRGGVALLFDEGMPGRVFKPRSLAIDVLWSRITAITRELCEGATPDAAESQDRGEHGFQEFVAYRSPETDEGRSAFFRRFGGLVALSYALSIGDLHRENVKCRGGSPVIVDAECLFALDPRAARETLGGRTTRPARSVLDSLLLPNWVKQFGAADAYDPSALGGAWDPQRMARGRELVRDAEGRLEFRMSETVVPQWVPAMPVAVEGQFPAQGYEHEIESGFAEMGELLGSPTVRASISAEVAAAEGVRSRFLRRSTVDYSTRLRWAQPVSEEGTGAEPLDRWLGEQERDALERGTIPMFEQSFDRPALIGGTSPDFALPSSLRDRALASLAELEVDDFRGQVPLLRRSLDLGADDPAAPVRRRSGVPADDVLEELIGRIVGGAVFGGRTVWWPTSHELDPGRWRLQATTPALYGGLSGITLALGIAAREHRGAEQPFLRCRDALRALVLDAADAADEGRALPGGAFTAAPLGALLVFASLAELDDSAADRRWVGSTAARIAPGLAPEEGGDVISGSAGAALALQRLLGVTGEKALRSREAEFIETLTDELTDAGTGGRLRGGLAHGLSGAALALGSSPSLSPDERAQAAATCFGREDALVRAAAIAREEGREDPRSVQLLSASWCWGATGQLRARLALGQAGSTERRDLLRFDASDTTLCHGGIGVWALQSSPEYRAAFGDRDAPATAAAIDHRLSRDLSPRSSMPAYATDPGLFTGDAGTLLYACARRESAAFDPLTLAYVPGGAGS